MLGSGNYSCLKVDLIFTRDRSFYFTTVFIPGIILVTSSFITFWLEWNAVPARVMIELSICRYSGNSSIIRVPEYIEYFSEYRVLLEYPCIEYIIFLEYLDILEYLKKFPNNSFRVSSPYIFSFLPYILSILCRSLYTSTPFFFFFSLSFFAWAVGPLGLPMRCGALSRFMAAE
ncbi:hypothetical protein P5V15_002747 [Pogonomyrmex californicus]